MGLLHSNRERQSVFMYTRVMPDVHKVILLLASSLIDIYSTCMNSVIASLK